MQYSAKAKELQLYGGYTTPADIVVGFLFSILEKKTPSIFPTLAATTHSVHLRNFAFQFFSFKKFRVIIQISKKQSKYTAK